MFLNMVVRHSELRGKLAIIVEDFYVKTTGWDYKIVFLTMKHGKVCFHVAD